MGYRIELAVSAKRSLDNLPKAIQKRIAVAIDRLALIPRPPGVIKLAGEDALYRIRVGRYRIIYQIDDDRSRVRVIAIGHRRDVYRR